MVICVIFKYKYSPILEYSYGTKAISSCINYTVCLNYTASTIEIGIRNFDILKEETETKSNQ